MRPVAAAAAAPVLSFGDAWLEEELVKLRAGVPELVPAARRAVRSVVESILSEPETQTTHTARLLLWSLDQD
jgi:hypothetical protein